MNSPLIILILYLSSNLTISVNDKFLSGTNNSEQAIREFKRNVFFSSSSSQPSGYSGTSNIYYASGRNTGDATTLEKIKVVEYNGFNETYANIKNIDRPWNWIAFNNDFETYLLFGNPVFQPTGLSLTNQTLTIHNQLSNTTISSNLSVNNYSLFHLICSMVAVTYLILFYNFLALRIFKFLPESGFTALT